ncbi:MAG: DUF885 domain-containing protein [Acidobacteriota bacterium]
MRRAFARRTLLTLTAALAVTACSSQPSSQPDRWRLVDTSAAQALDGLFAASNDRRLDLDPQAALGRGDRRQADRFGDYLSRRHLAARSDNLRRDLAALARIDRQALPAAQQVAYDAFRYRAETELAGFENGSEEILRQLPFDHLFGYHIAFPDMSSGQSLFPFTDLADYESGLRRLTGFARYLDDSHRVLRLGIEQGHVPAEFATRRVIDQLSAAVEGGVEGSPLLGPTKSFPDTIGDADRQRLTAAYERAIGETVMPAFARLETFFEEEYLPASRQGAPGLIGMTDGKALYRHLITRHTSSQMSPEEIHQLGLTEVARIRAAMEKIKEEVSFEGSLQEFFDFQRSDPQFKFDSAEELLAGYREIAERVRPRLSQLFPKMPRTPLEIRAVPEFFEQAAGSAYYYAGTPDGSRPGVFYVNTYDLPSRTRPTMETLYLHEALPGHHMQASLALEDLELPSFARFEGGTAYIEGWALYAESLGHEMGFFTDPYQHFGHLELEMFRALRLVVDTGLHDQGWSRQRAVDYMLANTSSAASVVIADVDRYVVWPGQALAYKLGQLTLRRLRDRAEEALGEDFDPRAFHAQVLDSGAVPLPVIEAKIEAWIADSD